MFGGTYVLGPEAMPEVSAPAASAAGGESGPQSAKDGGVQVKVPAHPTPLRSTHLVTSPAFLPSKPGSGSTSVTAHAVAVVTSQPACLKRAAKDDEEPEDDDTGVVIFPPAEGPLVRALIMGEGTGSCPAGQWVVYLFAELAGEQDPKVLLRPYLDRIGADVAFEAYYLAHRPEAPTEAPAEVPDAVVLVEPYAGSHMLTEGLDWEAEQGERAFRAVLPDGEFFPKPEGEEDEED